MASQITLPSSILAQLNGAIAVKYMNFVSYSLLVYDTILTMPDEMRLIWPWEWRIGKVLYLLTRYLIYIEGTAYSVFWFDKDLDVTNCKRLFDLGSWLGVVGVMIAHWIICMRTVALWEKSKVVMALLLFMCIGTEVPSLILMHEFLRNLVWARSPFPTIAPCTVSLNSSRLFIDYVMVMSIELCVISLTIWKGVSHWKVRGSHLLKVLYRDGIVFFIGLFIMSCANAVMYISSNKQLRGVSLSELQRVLHAVLTSRIILHLRQASVDGVWGQPTTSNGMGNVDPSSAANADGDVLFQDTVMSWGSMTRTDAWAFTYTEPENVGSARASSAFAVSV
ncbi:hypothetical protein SCHPADRAFT_909649 [Schizopora paradoxa]|uniref:DUF6533 domain-containing protein n=1 Tax=Schizopora paradoxa TaxID=27342 RepID=A0A0H2R635_9AGAM|nr:hypothetical protein SCHPADRAFT_909649 [Schizopora paradoxa]